MEFEYHNPATDQVECWEIEYRITPGTPERMNGLPEDWTPAEPGEIRKLTVFNEAGTDITNQVDSETIEQIESEIWEQEQILAD